MPGRKIIFFELNEVPYRVLDRSCAKRPNGPLARILAGGQQFTTFADSDTLMPTKTWPTVHRGVSSERHGLTNFGQNLDEVDRAFPPLWQILTRHKVKVGVFGSLFSFPMPKDMADYLFYMPDSFATTGEAYPRALAAFQHFNLAMSRASTRNVSGGIDVPGALGLVPHLLNLGFTFETAVSLAKQLVSERRNPRMKMRRRSFQSVLGFDVFFRQLRTQKPDFCTFFTNHVAATMHRYWAATFPEDYKHFGLTDDWVATYRDEIEIAMEQTDLMLGKLLDFVQRNPEYQLMLVTSMGQAAYVAEPVESYVSIVNMQRFLENFGLSEQDYEERPAMAPVFNVVVHEPKKQGALRNALKQLTIGEHNFATELYEGFFEFSFDSSQHYKGPQSVTIDGKKIPFAELGLGYMPHEDGVYLTADHVPEGALVIYDPKVQPSRTQRTQISTLDIAPMILSAFSISPPAYMSQSGLAKEFRSRPLALHQ